MKIDDNQKKEMRTGAVGGNRGKASLFNVSTFRSLENPVFRLYFGAMLCQMASMNMQLIARTLLVYRLTGSAVLLGVLALVNAIPMLCLTFFGGAIADRMQKKYVVLIGQAGSAVVALGVAISLSIGYLCAEDPGSCWVLIVAAFLQGTVMGLMMPSRQAMLYDIVEGKQIMNAVALNSFGMNFLRLLAHAATGVIIDAFNFEAVYYIMAALPLMAMGFIAFIPTTKRIVRNSSALTDIKEGLKYIRHDTNILLILVFTLFGVVLSMPYMQMLPIFVDDILKVGATGMGVMISVSAIGAMIGSLALASLSNSKRGLLLLISGLILGLALSVFSFSTSWSLSLVMMVFVGLGYSGRMTLSNALLQYYVENEYRGRVMSIYMSEFGVMSVGTFVAGLIAAAVGVQWAIGSFAMLLVLVSILAIAFVPRIRNLP